MKYKKTQALIFSLSILLIFLSATILMAGGNKELQDKLDQCNTKVGQLESENSSLKSQVESLQKKVGSLQSENQQLKDRIKELENEIAQKDKEIEKLKAQQEAPEPSIVSKTVEQQIQEKDQQIQALQLKKQELEANVQKINIELKQAQQQLAQLQQENTVLKSEKKALEEKVATVTKQKEEAEKALRVYESIQERTREMMDIALEKIREALKDEIESGEVRVFKGTMGIVLDVKGEPMFNEGSVKLNPNGRYIIQKIATLLGDLDGYMIGVIGNADNKPIVTPKIKRCYPTNWELSAQRGATVARYILEHSSVPPTRVVAMGLGEFQPIDTNQTPEGRGNNRRIDIVLLPMDVLSTVVIGAEIK